MAQLQLFPHQKKVLDATKGFLRTAYYLDMGLGKTFVGSEKLKELNNANNLIICQKSKLGDWVEHMETYYDLTVFNLTKYKQLQLYLKCNEKKVGVINYELVWRRDCLKNFNGTLMLDESSKIQNERTKVCRFISRMKPEGVILLSGTPTSGKYENLYSQVKLLGWDITKTEYWERYIKYRLADYGTGYPIREVTGYNNVDELKCKLRDFGARFMKTEEVLDLPEQIETVIQIKCHPRYNRFIKDRIVEVDGVKWIGDTSLTKYLRARQLCTMVGDEKLTALKDILDSTEERVIVFYQFTEELNRMRNVVNRPVSIVSGNLKDLDAYEDCNDSVTFVQYQAGAMGLNLQKANTVVYFGLTDRSELFEQSKKRVHRIGQTKPCFYYYLITKSTVEEKIFESLQIRRDYNAELFTE